MSKKPHPNTEIDTVVPDQDCPICQALGLRTEQLSVDILKVVVPEPMRRDGSFENVLAYQLGDSATRDLTLRRGIRLTRAELARAIDASRSTKFENNTVNGFLLAAFNHNQPDEYLFV